jgi:hypothetical protein
MRQRRRFQIPTGSIFLKPITLSTGKNSFLLVTWQHASFHSISPVATSLLPVSVREFASHTDTVRGPVYDDAGNAIETREHRGDFREWQVLGLP